MSIFASNSALQAWLPELPDRAPHLAPWLQVLFSYYFEQWMSNLLVDDYKILTTFKGVMILHILFNMMYIYIILGMITIILCFRLGTRFGTRSKASLWNAVSSIALERA
jgi:hypothetical protein